MHTYSLIFLGLAALMITGSRGQSIARGSCPNLNVVQNFRRRQFFGVWYVAAEYKLSPDEQISCKTLEYGPRNVTSMWVSESYIDANGQLRTGRDVITFVDQYTGRLQTRKKNRRITFRGKSIPIPVPNYLVVATDYNKFAVIASCYELEGNSARRVHILTRRRQVDPRVFRKARRIIREEGLQLDELSRVDQSNCTDK